MRPIQTIKHVTDNQGGSAPGIQTNVVIASAVINPDLTGDPSLVEAGSKIFSIFLNVQVETDSGAALNNAYFFIYKNPQNNIPQASIPNANAQGASNFRRQVFHSEMSMLSDAGDSIPITLFKGVLKIPKVFQSMRQDDQIVVQIFSPGNTIDFCVQSIYKEVR